MFSPTKKTGAFVASSSSSASSLVSLQSFPLEQLNQMEKVRESKKERAPLKDRISKLPEPTKFTSSTGQIATFYFKNNPWKFSEDNNWNKIFRYCVICGDERFSKDVWSIKIDMMGKPPITCFKRMCYENLLYIPAFVPRKHYIVTTPQDKQKARIWPQTQPDSYENVKSITTH